MKKKIINWLLLTIFFVLCVNLVRTYFHLQTQRNDMVLQSKQRDTLFNTQDQLKRELAGIGTADYMEKQMREKLNMGRKDEIVVLVPTILPTFTPTPTPIKNTVEQWVEVFK